MTGPEHYQEAERWALKAEPGSGSARGQGETAELCTGLALAHGLLALAAGVGLTGFGEMPVPDAEQWLAATAVPAEQPTLKSV